MNVLVLGNSDTAAIHSGARVWTRIVRDGLAERVGGVDWQDMTLLVTARTAPARIEARVRDFEPDLVIMPVGTYLWTVGFVAMRVRRLAGGRVSSAYKRLEEQFDAGTRRKGVARDRVNRAARAVAHRTIGATPIATQEQTTEATRVALSTLARLEQTHVAVVSYLPESPAFLHGSLLERRKRFFLDIRKATEERHFTWISGDDALAESGFAGPIMAPDGFHFNAAGHEIHGAYVLRRILSTIELPTSAR